MRGLTMFLSGWARSGLALCGTALLGLAVAGATRVAAAECPGNPDALGTSRTIVVDPTEHPRLGSMQYRESLPLQDHEIVITFDDGPLPARSSKVLDILAHECTKATYFMVGKMARAYPDMVRRIHEAGHTIGTHSYSHPLTFHKMSLEKAQFEINEGIASVNWALGEGATTAPFFRIPGLLRADGVERYLASQHLQVWSADFPADDWLHISPAQVYARAIKYIEANHRGILLLHDIQAKTVEALPNILHELKRRGYRVVHVVPASPDNPKTATDPQQWLMHARQIWPQAPIFLESEEPELPAPGPASIGLDGTFYERALDRAPVHRPRARLARGQVPLPPVSIWPREPEGGQAMPATRPQLPAPSPESFGYPGRTSTPGTIPGTTPGIPRKASFDVVPETTGAANDIRRLLETLPPEEGPTGSLRGPAATANMPRGAYP
jgi:peptidoglycan/xylan/chitin deacetylase (PgdA/CDA1 family)